MDLIFWNKRMKVVVVALLGLLLFTFNSCVSCDNPSSDHPVEKWMSVYDGSIFDLEYEVKRMLNDPSSFEHIETSYNDSGTDVKVRMKFRAKNKLGALVINQADAILDTDDGTVSQIVIK